VTGSVTYRERIALTPGTVVEVKLLDVSLQDVTSKVISEQIIEVKHQVPIPFELIYDQSQIDQHLTYAVRATIRHGKKLLFTTDRSYPVLTRGKGDQVDLVLVRVGGKKEPVAKADLVDTKWILKILEGQAITAGETQRPAFIQFVQHAERAIVTGNGGCNNFHGGYELEASKLSFGKLASTAMACPDMELERQFYDALERVNRFSIDGSWLVFYDTEDELARFETGNESGSM
jgi:putative lipoprotein